VLEDGQAEHGDADDLEDAVLEPGVERRVMPVAEREGLGEEELLGLIVLGRARREEPDPKVEERVGDENGD
jgi:hypothetical protein